MNTLPIINKQIKEDFSGEFFQTIWRLQHQHHVPLSAIILRSQPELAFFAAEILHTEIKEIDESATTSQWLYECWCNFIGLIGAHGSLPNYFNQELLMRWHGRDNPLHVLYDWLQQRSWQLLYEGWEQRRRLPLVDKSQNAPSTLLAAVSGLAPQHPWQTDPYQAYIHYFCGHFANYRRSASALAKILCSVLQVETVVTPLNGAWVPLNRLHAEPIYLGQNALLGTQVWALDAKLTLTIGPIAVDDLLAYMPGGTFYLLISALLKRFAGNEYHWCLQLLIDNTALLACTLTDPAWSSLGRTSFLAGQRSSGINSDIIMEINHYDDTELNTINSTM